MAVLIFPVDYKKLTEIIPGEGARLTLQPIIDGCKTLAVGLASGDYKETRHGVGKEPPDGSEVIERPSTIKVVDLPFTEDDIPEYWSFGNGVTVGSINLKDGRVIPCAWVVLPSTIPNQAILSNIKGLLS